MTSRSDGPAPVLRSIRPPSFAPASDAFAVLDSEPGAFLFGVWKNILVAVWRSQATGPAVERLAKATDAVAARRPGPRSNVHLIASGAGLPTAEARAAFVTLMKRNAESLACVAIVIDGTGFWSGALRAALSGIHVLSPRSFDFRLLGATEDVVRWLPAAHERKTGVPVDAQLLRVVLEAAPRADERP
jgi:hypothetical protein